MHFNIEFYPTPENVINTMLEGLTIEGKTFLEPSAGAGNIVKALQSLGAQNVIACEKDPDLKKIVATLCPVIADDFLKVTSDQISHINGIIMNPPFSRGAEHILHAFEIAPDGCDIVALCNLQTLKNTYSKSREQLSEIVKAHGDFQNLGDCFSNANRKTYTEIALVRLKKPGSSYEKEFEGFFTDEEPEEQANGLMSYNAIRDLVNRYVESIKIFDQQLETAAKLNEMQSGYFDRGKTELAISINRQSIPVKRNDFKKDMQRAGWLWIFDKLNMQKYATQGLKEDINKFVETQENIPFTMRNIYKMLEIVIGTTGQRMDKAVLEVFDKITAHHADNRKGLEGFKTNSHYLLTKKFIAPSVTEISWGGGVGVRIGARGFEMIEDLSKALCYLTGKNYDETRSLESTIRNPFALADKDGKYIRDPYFNLSHMLITGKDYEEMKQKQARHPESQIKGEAIAWGEWFEWEFFKCKAYKKGTLHMEFKEEKVWAMFNQKVAKLKGYPLPEQKEQTAYQQRQNGRKPEQKAPAQKAKVLFTVDLFENA